MKTYFLDGWKSCLDNIELAIKSGQNANDAIEIAKASYKKVSMMSVEEMNAEEAR